MNDLGRFYDRLVESRRSLLTVALCMLGLVGVAAESPIIFQLMPRWGEFAAPFEPVGPEGVVINSSLQYEPLWLPSDSEDRFVRTWMESSGTYAGRNGGVGIEHTFRFNEVRAADFGPDIDLENVGRDEVVAAHGAIGPPVLRVSGAVGRGKRESLTLGFSSRSRMGRFGYTYRQAVGTVPVALLVAGSPIISPPDTDQRNTTHVLDYRRGGLLLLLGAGSGEAEQKSPTYRLMFNDTAYWARIAMLKESFGIDALAGLFESSLHVRSEETRYGALERIRGGAGHLGITIPVTTALEFSGSATYVFAELTPPNHLWTVPFFPGGSWYYYRVRNIEGDAAGFISRLGMEYGENIVSSRFSIDGRVGFHVVPFVLRSQARAETAVMYPSALPRYSDNELYRLRLDGSLAHIQLELVTTYRRAMFAVGATQWLPLLVRREMSGTIDPEDASLDSRGVRAADAADMIWAGTQFSVSLRLGW